MSVTAEQIDKLKGWARGARVDEADCRAKAEAEFRRAEQYRIDAETFEAALKLAEQEAKRLEGAISVAEAPGGWLSVLRGGGR